VVGGFGGFRGGFLRTTAPAAPDFGERRCFWHQTHVEAHERIAGWMAGTWNLNPNRNLVDIWSWWCAGGSVVWWIEIGSKALHVWRFNAH